MSTHHATATAAVTTVADVDGLVASLLVGGNGGGHQPQQQQHQHSSDLFAGLTTTTTANGSTNCALQALHQVSKTILQRKQQKQEGVVPAGAATTTTSTNIATDLFPRTTPIDAIAVKGQLVRCIGMVQDVSDTPMLLQSAVDGFYGGIVGLSSNAPHSNNSNDGDHNHHHYSNQPQPLLTRLIEAHQAYIVPIPGSDYSFLGGGVAGSGNDGEEKGTTKRRTRDEDDDAVADDDDEETEVVVDGGNGKHRRLEQPMTVTVTTGGSKSAGAIAGNVNGGAQQFTNSNKNPLHVAGVSTAPDHTADGGGGLLNLPTAPVNASLAYGCVATYLGPCVVGGDEEEEDDEAAPSKADATTAGGSETASADKGHSSKLTRKQKARLEETFLGNSLHSVCGSSAASSTTTTAAGGLLKVNQIVECYGFLMAPHPQPQGHHQQPQHATIDGGDDAAMVDHQRHHQGSGFGGNDGGCGGYFGGGFDDLFDEFEADDEGAATFRYERLPTTLAPRLVCVAIRPVTNPSQIIMVSGGGGVGGGTTNTSPVTAVKAQSVQQEQQAQQHDHPSPQWCKATRAALLQYLCDEVTAGDMLLAEYLLLHLVSTVDFWHGGVHVPVGDVPLRVLVPDVAGEVRAVISTNTNSTTITPLHAIDLAKVLSNSLRPINAFGSTLLNLTQGMVAAGAGPSAGTTATTTQALSRGFGGTFLTATPTTTGDTAAGTAGQSNTTDAQQATSAASPTPTATTFRSLMPYKDNKENSIVAAPLQLPNHHHLTVAVDGQSGQWLGGVESSDSASTTAPTTTASTGTSNHQQQQAPPAIPNANCTAEDDLLTLIHKQHTVLDYVVCKVEQQADVRCLVVGDMAMKASGGSGNDASAAGGGVTTTPASSSVSFNTNRHDDLQTIAPLRLACTVVWEPTCVRHARQLRQQQQQEVVGVVVGANGNGDDDDDAAPLSPQLPATSATDAADGSSGSSNPHNNHYHYGNNNMGELSSLRGHSNSNSMGAAGAFGGGCDNPYQQTSGVDDAPNNSNGTAGTATALPPTVESVNAAFNKLLAKLSHTATTAAGTDNQHQQLSDFRMFIDYARRSEEDDDWLFVEGVVGREVDAITKGTNASTAVTSSNVADTTTAATPARQLPEAVLKAAAAAAKARQEAAEAQRNNATTAADDDDVLVIGDDVNTNTATTTISSAGPDTAAAQQQQRLRREAKQTEETILNELIEWQSAEPEAFNHDALLHNNSLSIIMSLCRAYSRSYARVPRSVDAEERREGRRRALLRGLGEMLVVAAHHTTAAVDGNNGVNAALGKRLIALAAGGSTCIQQQQSGTNTNNNLSQQQQSHRQQLSLLHELLSDFYNVQKLERQRFLRGVKYGYYPH